MHSIDVIYVVLVFVDGKYWQLVFCKERFLIYKELIPVCGYYIYFTFIVCASTELKSSRGYL